MALFVHSNCNSCHDWVCLRQSDLFFLYWCSVFGLCGCKAIEPAHIFHRFSVHLYVGLLFWLDAVDENVASALPDFHVVTSSRFLQSFSEFVGSSFSLPPSRSMSSANRKTKAVVLRWTMTTVGCHFSLSFCIFYWITCKAVVIRYMYWP